MVDDGGLGVVYGVEPSRCAENYVGAQYVA